jgi:hypothetical protein
MKKYLVTPEEVIKALKEGKNVKSETGCCYKMIDGVISVSGRNGWCIGTHINDAERPHIEEVAPLKIEVGKFYKTKGNKKAYVYLDYGNGLFRAVCDCYTNSYCIDDKGEYTSYPKVDKLNIVSLWEE